MGGQKEIAERIAGILLQYVFHQEEIIQGLTHLFRVNGNEAIMEPVIYEMAAGAAFGLGDFIFMMRENQIRAAAMEIKGLAQVMDGHGGAFDMPARTSLAPGAFPERFTGLSSLPQREIAGVLLFIVHFDAGTGQHVFHFAAGQFSVIIESGNIIIHIAAQYIGMALFDKGFHHLMMSSM